MNSPRVAGLILAGGRSSRFEGGRKEDAQFLGSALADHVARRAAPQVTLLAVSRAIDDNRPAGEFPVVHDNAADKGPLAGVAAGLFWARGLSPAADFLATFPCDTPLIPVDLVARLLAATNGKARGAIAASGGVIHPTCALWPVGLAPLAQSRLNAGELSLMGLAEAAGAIIVEFGADAADAFTNVNTAEDLAALAMKIRPIPQ